LGFNFFSSTMGTIDSVKSILTQSALDAMCEKYYIHNVVHHELLDRNDRICNSPTFKTEMDLFAFITHADPTKVQIGEREMSMSGCCDDDVNDGDGDVAEVNKTKQGASGSGLPPKKLREDHSTFDICANKGGKSVTTLQSLLERSTLSVEVSVAAVTTVPFVTSSVTPDSISGTGLRTRHPAKRSSMPLHPVLTAAIATTITAGWLTPSSSLLPFQMDLFAFITHADPTKVQIGEREMSMSGCCDDDVNDGDGDVAEVNKTKQGASGSGLPPKKLREDHITFDIGANKGGKSVTTLQSLLERTKRFVISLDSSHDLNVNATYDEVTFVIRSFMPLHPVLTAAIATTITAGATFASAPGSDVVGPSQPVGTKLSAESFYISQDMDHETLRQVYIPKWNVINDFILDAPNVCRGMIDHFALPGFFSQLWGIDYEQLFTEFNVGTARQVCFNAEIRMRLEHELRGRQSFEGKCAMQANWLKEMDVKIASLKAQLSLKEAEATEAIHLRVLEGHIVALKSAVVSKDVELASSNAQVAKVTQDLSSLQLSCDELSVNASSLEFEKEKLVDQVEAMQDEYVNVLSDRVTSIDSNLMEMALHMDEEFYPRYLTTIAKRRWILSRAINKGMQDGLAAGIDHGKVRRSLVDVSAYNPFVEADYVAAINALRAMDFPFLAQLESRKDASMAEIMDLLPLEGPAAETPEASQLQP
nr:hypothetical protein [Tanacetum cinerariifolium]